MTDVTRTLVLMVVAPIVLCSAALGLSAAANASSTGLGGQDPTGPGNSFSPNTYAHPAPTVPGGWHRHGHPSYSILVVGGDEG